MRFIHLTKGQYTLVDTEDYPKLSRYRWHAIKTRDDSGGYAYSQNTNIANLILDCPKDKAVGYINGNSLDNRKHNLKIVNAYQKPTSGYRFPGVYWEANRQQWRVQIYVDGKKYNKGQYKCFGQAIKARRQAEEEHWGGRR